MDEIDFYQETLLDNYMEERAEYNITLPWNQMPTLAEWLDA